MNVWDFTILIFKKENAGKIGGNLMKNHSLVLTVSLIAMMIVGAAHGAQIASTDYVTKSVGDEANMVWDSFDTDN